jgi:5-formaminoimidazole-4-carboxamide-1-beta-D-ribofuranosyl 5'-monophosphate synthetase
MSLHQPPSLESHLKSLAHCSSAQVHGAKDRALSALVYCNIKNQRSTYRQYHVTTKGMLTHFYNFCQHFCNYLKIILLKGNLIPQITF